MNPSLNITPYKQILKRRETNSSTLKEGKGVSMGLRNHGARDKYLASEKNASSTLIFAFAEVSMNGIPNSFAKARPCSSDTTRFSLQSHLFPISILWTPSVACCSTFWNQVRMSTVNVLLKKYRKHHRELELAGLRGGEGGVLLKERSSQTS